MWPTKERWPSDITTATIKAEWQVSPWSAVTLYTEHSVFALVISRKWINQHFYTFFIRYLSLLNRRQTTLLPPLIIMEQIMKNACIKVASQGFCMLEVQGKHLWPGFSQFSPCGPFLVFSLTCRLLKRWFTLSIFKAPLSFKADSKGSSLSGLIASRVKVISVYHKSGRNENNKK